MVNSGHGIVVDLNSVFVLMPIDARRRRPSPVIAFESIDFQCLRLPLLPLSHPHPPLSLSPSLFLFFSGVVSINQLMRDPLIEF